MTPQERSASALEDIVDRLAEIEEARWVIGRDIYRSLGYDEMALAALADNISMDDGGSSSAVNPGSAWPSTDKDIARGHRSEEHTSELQSLMRISYAVFCLKKKTNKTE